MSRCNAEMRYVEGSGTAKMTDMIRKTVIRRENTERRSLILHVFFIELIDGNLLISSRKC